jgi:hypothetical protein
MEFYGKDIAYLFMGEYHLATEKLQPENPSKPSLDLIALNKDIKKILENNAVRVKELVDIFVEDRPGVLADWIENHAERTVVISVEILLPFIPNVDLSEEQVPDLVPDKPKDAIKHLTENMIGLSTITLTPLHLAVLFGSRKCIDYLLLPQNSPPLKPYSKETGNGWLPVDFVPKIFADTRYADIKARLKRATNIKQSIHLLDALRGYAKSSERWKYLRAIEEQIAEAISLDNYISSINDQNNPTTKQLTEKLEKLIWLSVLDTISDDTPESKIDRIVMRHREAQQIANELELLDPLAKSKYLNKCLGVFAAGLIGLVVLGAVAVGIMVACSPAVGAVLGIIVVAGITKASLPMSVAGFLLGFLPGALIRHHTLFSVKSPPERFLEVSEKVVMTSKNH